MSAPAEPEKVVLTPTQLGCVLVFEACLSSLSVGAAQLGSFMGLTEEAKALAKAAEWLQREYESLRAGWAQKKPEQNAAPAPEGAKEAQ